MSFEKCGVTSSCQNQYHSDQYSQRLQNSVKISRNQRFFTVTALPATFSKKYGDNFFRKIIWLLFDPIDNMHGILNDPVALILLVLFELYRYIVRATCSCIICHIVSPLRPIGCERQLTDIYESSETVLLMKSMNGCV